MNFWIHQFNYGGICGRRKTSSRAEGFAANTPKGLSTEMAGLEVTRQHSHLGRTGKKESQSHHLHTFASLPTNSNRTPTISVDGFPEHITKVQVSRWMAFSWCKQRRQGITLNQQRNLGHDTSTLFHLQHQHTNFLSYNSQYSLFVVKHFTSLHVAFSASKSNCCYLPGIHSVFQEWCSSNWVQPGSSCFRVCW